MALNKFKVHIVSFTEDITSLPRAKLDQLFKPEYLAQLDQCHDKNDLLAVLHVVRRYHFNFSDYGPADVDFR